MYATQQGKRRAALALALILAPMAVLGLSGCQKSSGAVLPTETLPVRVSTVHLEPATQESRYSAVIRPRVEADMGFRVAGKVIARLVNVGARVDAGTPLARIDPADIELALKASKAQLEAARADLLNTRENFARAQRLRQSDFTSRQDYDGRLALMQKAEAAVRQAQSDVDAKANSLQYATLVADGPGVVTATLVEPGQVVAAGQTAIRVARLGEMEAVANIPENKVADLDKASLSVELWAFPGQPVAGALRELSPSADAATRTFQAKISLKTPPEGVQLGMTATVRVSWAVSGTLVRLPLAAVSQSGADPAVWVVKPDAGELELRPIKVLAYAGNEVVVGNGLAEGEKVVNAGVHKLVAGQRVRIWGEDAR